VQCVAAVDARIDVRAVQRQAAVERREGVGRAVQREQRAAAV
jgi:hypothetical protein